MIRPGSVNERTRLPCRVKISTPSSSSSSMMALETPGWDVNRALAASVRLKFWRTASRTKRNWCRFIYNPSAYGKNFLVV